MSLEIIDENNIKLYLNEGQQGAVTEDGIQTLTNKTLVSPALTDSPTAPTPTAGNSTTLIATTAFVAGELASKVAATSGTASGLTLSDGYTEEVFTVTGTTPALSPTNGSIQTWALSGNSTPTAGTWAAGQSMTLMIDDGTAYTINWATLAVVWKTNAAAAPTLQTTGMTAIQFWKVGTVIYGARVGDA